MQPWIFLFTVKETVSTCDHQFWLEALILDVNGAVPPCPLYDLVDLYLSEGVILD
jgi:hypothetical protein